MYRETEGNVFLDLEGKIKGNSKMIGTILWKCNEKCELLRVFEARV